jgi:hypothetical protein
MTTSPLAAEEDEYEDEGDDGSVNRREAHLGRKLQILPSWAASSPSRGGVSFSPPFAL